jgi:hypothetical protein
MDLFSLQARGTPTLLGPLETAKHKHWTQQSRCLPLLTLRRKQIQFQKRCVF